MVEFIEGILILIIPLLMVFIMLIKWRRDYKLTGKILVLYDKMTKYWLILFIIVLFIIWVVDWSGYSVPLPIKIKEWNPAAWYG